MDREKLYEALPEHFDRLVDGPSIPLDHPDDFMPRACRLSANTLFADRRRFRESYG